MYLLIQADSLQNPVLAPLTTGTAGLVQVACPSATAVPFGQAHGLPSQVSGLPPVSRCVASQLAQDSTGVQSYFAMTTNFQFFDVLVVL